MKIKLMSNREEKLGFILGAGASQPAGIPTAYPLTSIIFDKIKENSPALTNHLSAIIGGLKFAKSMEGHGPNDQLNIEEVVSALKLIVDRKELEISPFVEGWHPIIEKLDKSEYIIKNNIKKAIDKYSKEIEKQIQKASNLATERAIKESKKGNNYSKSNFNLGSSLLESRTSEIATSITNAIFKPSVNNFSNLYSFMHAMLIEIMLLENSELVIYLKPLLKLTLNTSIPIFTLNYDNTIELLAKHNHIQIFDGFSEENYFISKWPENEPGIHLYKLHGSVTWITNNNNDILKITNKESRNFNIPTLVFGQRDKLRSDGPFLDLLFEFKKQLENINKLIVIGYSFGDIHINKYLKEWIKDKNNQLIIVNGEKFKFDYIKHEFLNNERITNSGQSCENFLKNF
jgi:hypothetical protein